MVDHAKLSPSSCSRWFNCPGSIKLVEEHGEDTGDKSFAHDGTILHGIMEDCLRDDRDPYEWLGENVKLSKYRDEDDYKVDYELEITDELCGILADGLDEIDGIPGKLFIEKRVDLGRWMPGQFGTLDVGIIGRKRIHIWDHKFGMIPVSPVRNKQISCYALGFWDNIAKHQTDVTEFRFHVWQPRCFAGDGGGVWDTNLEELLSFGKELSEKARATERPNAPRIPGNAQCMYCPGAQELTCPEYVDQQKRLLFGDDDEIIEESIEHGLPPKFRTISPEERSWIIEHRSSINKFLDRLQAQALDDAIKGRPTPGMKAVQGRRPPRKWKDADAVEARLKKILGDDAYTRKIMSPTQAEKELSQSMYGSLIDDIERGDPKPILVAQEAGGEPIQSLLDMFNEDEDCPE